MSSSDPMKRAAQRIAIDYPVEIVRMPGGASVSRMQSGDAGDTRTGPSQGPKGGQFAPGGGRVTGKGKKPTTRRPGRRPAAKPGSPKPLSFDGKRGTGYGIKGGDPRVRSLQSILNRFGLTDSRGRALAVDGKYGPLTTSAVKKLQRAMGVEVNGVVDDAFLKRVSAAKSLSELRPPKPTRPRARRQAGRSMLPGFMGPGDADGFGDGFEDVDTSPPTDRHVLDNGICVTCKMREQMSEPHVFDNGVCVTCGDAGPKGQALTDAERAVDALIEALDEVFRTRYVRTPAGAKKYGVPIGSPIGGDHGPHVPKPHTPGKKGTLKDRLVSAITEHLDGKGDGKPLAGFNREQLRQAAKSRGIKLDRGEHEDSIAAKLIAHARGDSGDSPKPDTPESAKPPVKKVAKKAARPALSKQTLADLSDEQIANGITMHGTDSPKGRLLAAEQSRRRAAKKPEVAVLGMEQLDEGKVRENHQSAALAASRLADSWKVSDADLEALARENGIWPHIADYDPRKRRERYAEQIIRQSQGSSGGPEMTAAVAAVADRLGATYELEAGRQRIRDFIRSDPHMDAATRSLGEAMYAETQKWFADRGITHVRAYRGSRGVEGDSKQLHTSWSTGRGTIRDEGGTRIVRDEVIPVERIFSIPTTGFGSLDELELIVLPELPKSG